MGKKPRQSDGLAVPSLLGRLPGGPRLVQETIGNVVARANQALQGMNLPLFDEAALSLRHAAAAALATVFFSFERAVMNSFMAVSKNIIGGESNQEAFLFHLSAFSEGLRLLTESVNCALGDLQEGRAPLGGKKINADLLLREARESALAVNHIRSLFLQLDIGGALAEQQKLAEDKAKQQAVDLAKISSVTPEELPDELRAALDADRGIVAPGAPRQELPPNALIFEGGQLVGRKDGR